MKQLVLGVVLGMTLAFGVGAAAERPIRLFVNGNEVFFADAPPQMINGRVMVPARPLAEALGAIVKWDSEQNAVIVESKVPEVSAPTPEPSPTPAPAPSPRFLTVNGRQTERRVWLDEEGQPLLDSTTLLNEVLAPIYPSSLPGIKSDGTIYWGRDQIGKLETIMQGNRPTFSMESLKALGLVDYTWNAESLELTVWVPTQGR